MRMKILKNLGKICIVNNCAIKNFKDESGKRVSMHEFPRIGLLREDWVKIIEKINKNKINVRKNLYICGKHFAKNCFIKLGSSAILKNQATPTIFLKSEYNMKKKLQESTVEKEPISCPKDNCENFTFVDIDSMGIVVNAIECGEGTQLNCDIQIKYENNLRLNDNINNTIEIDPLNISDNSDNSMHIDEFFTKIRKDEKMFMGNIKDNVLLHAHSDERILRSLLVRESQQIRRLQDEVKRKNNKIKKLELELELIKKYGFTNETQNDT